MWSDLAAALCRAYNNWLADYGKPYPSRLIGVAVVPMQNVDEAAKEARRSVEKLGMRGVMIRPNPYKGRNWDDPAYDPFWAEMQSLEVPVGVHEGTTGDMPTAGADRCKNFFFMHIISQPHEQQSRAPCARKMAACRADVRAAHATPGVPMSCVSI